jgi:hypothetical protein
MDIDTYKNPPYSVLDTKHVETAPVPIDRPVTSDDEFREAIRACQTPYETEALLHMVSGLTQEEQDRFHSIWDRMDY